MEKSERKEMAAELAGSMLDDFEKSIRRVVSLFGNEAEALNKVLLPELREITGCSFVGLFPGVPPGTVITRVTPCVGERRSLSKLLGGDDWKETLRRVKASCGDYDCPVRVGDYLKIPLRIEAAEHKGVEYEAVDIASTEVTVVNARKGQIVFVFEDVVTFGAMNRRDTTKGGFAESAMAEYLNAEFLKSFEDVADILALNKDGLRISLLTKYEVFGEGNGEMNWPLIDPEQFEYFRKYKNRIKVKDDDTKWWWLSSAAAVSNFCYVSDSGGLTSAGTASSVGGCAPALCVAV